MEEEEEQNDRRSAEGTRRIEDRVDRLEETMKTIAPVTVHLAEMNVRYAELTRVTADMRGDMRAGQAELHAELTSWIDRLDKRLDPLHTRLRKVEYAVIVLGLAALSPKLGGPDMAHTVGTLIQTWFG